MDLMEERLREKANTKLKLHLNNFTNLDSSANMSNMPTIVRSSTAGRMQRRSRSVSYSDLQAEHAPPAIPASNGWSQLDQPKVGIKAISTLPVRSCASVSGWPDSFPPSDASDLSDSLASSNVSARSDSLAPIDVRPISIAKQPPIQGRLDYVESECDLSNVSELSRPNVKPDNFDSGYYDINNKTLAKFKRSCDVLIESPPQGLQVTPEPVIPFKPHLLAVNGTHNDFRIRKSVAVFKTGDVHARFTPGYQSGNQSGSKVRTSATPSLSSNFLKGAVDGIDRSRSAQEVKSGTRFSSNRALLGNVEPSLKPNTSSDNQKSSGTFVSTRYDVIHKSCTDDVTDQINNSVSLQNGGNLATSGSNDYRFGKSNISTASLTDSTDFFLSDPADSSTFLSTTYLSLSLHLTQQSDARIKILHKPTDSTVSDCTTDSGLEGMSSFSSDPPQTTNSFDDPDTPVSGTETNGEYRSYVEGHAVLQPTSRTSQDDLVDGALISYPGDVRNTEALCQKVVVCDAVPVLLPDDHTAPSGKFVSSGKFVL